MKKRAMRISTLLAATLIGLAGCVGSTQSGGIGGRAQEERDERELFPVGTAGR